MSLIERYIMVEIRRLVIMIAGFLIFMFASYSAQRYLTDAANGTLALRVVADVVFYKALIALEMILPVALYVSVAVALSQLYSDAEITAMQASGASPLRLYKAILILAIPLATGVTLLSMYGRPWAYANIYQLQQESQSMLDVSHLQANKFNVSGNGRMILASEIDKTASRLTEALIYLRSASHTHLYRAHSVEVIDASPGNPVVRLKTGSAYVLDRQGRDDNAQNYVSYDIALKPLIPDPEFRHKSASLTALAHSVDPADTAELQWRESRGLITVLMVLLAIPLSRTRPRQGRYATLLPLTLMFTVIFYGGNICRTLVANGSLPVVPGIWLVPLVMALGMGALLARDVSLPRKISR
ncbi:LPS export ABC transporter permease LptF [Klebsiella indica]|uniref:Lipopolysaccharide export system permease protein LptF n=1 Tax=Klebsiella indica TaxID=2582917 RepID=A0A5R9LE30_9ENTR|nr:LPS export ABC transporter permease LptF [Klebsiella indica]TLV11681.1 LPS export ABC transporter permease LptF [Klebsiella indica]